MSTAARCSRPANHLPTEWETDVCAVQNPNYEADVKGYLAAWPSIFQDVTHIDPRDEAFARRVFDTWVVILFRAWYWRVCHCFVHSERVPLTYYGS